MMKNIYDVIIIGSGPAGLTAGIYTSRANLKTLLIAGERWGGQLMLTTEVENYPGFSEGIMGPMLVEEMRKQALRFGVEWIGESVSKVDFTKRSYKVWTDGLGIHNSEGEILKPQYHSIRGTQVQDDDQLETRNPSAPSTSLRTGSKLETSYYVARSVILAVGVETKWLGVPGEKELIGRGVSSCAPCDAAFFRNKRVLVVGGGDAAMEEALVLTKFALEVTILHRRDTFRASQIMVNRVMKHKKIKVFWDTEVEELLGEKVLEGVVLKTKKERWNIDQEMMLKRGIGEKIKNQKLNIKNGDKYNENRLTDNDFVRWSASVDGVFVAIGHTPSTDLFKGQLELDEKGYILNQMSNVKIQMSKLRKTEVRSQKSVVSGQQEKKITDNRQPITDNLWLHGYPTMTSVPGVFAVGDGFDYRYKQAITAAGYGCMGAMDAEKWLEEEGSKN